MPNLALRSFVTEDRDAWESLWNGYITFYESSVTEDVTDHLWAQLTGDGPVFGRGAFAGDQLLGFTHFIFHPSSWTTTGYCYLEDLFTSQAARGRGVGRALIEAVRSEAVAANATRLYWNTQKHNGTARILYDKLAREAGFV